MTREDQARNDAVACAMLVCFALIAWFTSGCGASPITVAARGVDVTAQMLAPTMDAARLERARELDACEAAAEALACLDAGEAEWRPRIAALNAARDALDAVLSGLELAHAHEAGAPTVETLVALAHLALNAWMAAGRTGIDMPALPPEVLALLGGSPS